MQRASKPETVGVFLLGAVLFTLSLSLRASQPGLLETSVPGYVWPVGACAIYLALAFALAGLTVRWALLLAMMVGAHLLYATLMGFAFATMANGVAALSFDPVLQGLASYPPAVFVQAAFVVLVGGVVIWPRLRPPNEETFPGQELIEKAHQPEELLQAVLKVEAIQGSGADPTLVAISRRAREILGVAGEAPAEDGVEEESGASPPEQPVLLEAPESEVPDDGQDT